MTQRNPKRCPAGSLEQQLDMCESGPLRGDELLHQHDRAEKAETDHFRPDMSEENREGDEMSGDDHSSGLQGGDPELQSQPHESGMPGDETRIEEYLERQREPRSSAARHGRTRK